MPPGRGRRASGRAGGAAAAAANDNTAVPAAAEPEVSLRALALAERFFKFPPASASRNDFCFQCKEGGMLANCCFGDDGPKERKCPYFYCASCLKFEEPFICPLHTCKDTAAVEAVDGLPFQQCHTCPTAYDTSAPRNVAGRLQADGQQQLRCGRCIALATRIHAMRTTADGAAQLDSFALGSLGDLRLMNQMQQTMTDPNAPLQLLLNKFCAVMQPQPAAAAAAAAAGMAAAPAAPGRAPGDSEPGPAPSALKAAMRALTDNITRSPGQSFVLVGLNGVGKTMLINTVLMMSTVDEYMYRERNFMAKAPINEAGERYLEALDVVAKLAAAARLARDRNAGAGAAAAAPLAAAPQPQALVRGPFHIQEAFRGEERDAVKTIDRLQKIAREELDAKFFAPIKNFYKATWGPGALVSPLLPSGNQTRVTSCIEVHVLFGTTFHMLVVLCTPKHLRELAYSFVQMKNNPDAAAADPDERKLAWMRYQAITGQGKCDAKSYSPAAYKSIDVAYAKSADDIVVGPFFVKLLEKPYLLIGPPPGGHTQVDVDRVIVRTVLDDLMDVERRSQVGLPRAERLFDKDGTPLSQYLCDRLRFAIDCVYVFSPASICEGGTELVDVPGTNDMDPFNGDTTRRALDRATGAIVCLEKSMDTVADVSSLLLSTGTYDRVLRRQFTLAILRMPEKSSRVYLENLLPVEEGQEADNGVTLRGLQATNMLASWESRASIMQSLETAYDRLPADDPLKDAAVGGGEVVIASAIQTVAFETAYPIMYASLKLIRPTGALSDADLDTAIRSTNGDWVLGLLDGVNLADFRREVASFKDHSLEAAIGEVRARKQLSESGSQAELQGLKEGAAKFSAQLRAVRERDGAGMNVESMMREFETGLSAPWVVLKAALKGALEPHLRDAVTAFVERRKLSSNADMGNLKTKILDGVTNARSVRRSGASAEALNPAHGGQWGHGKNEISIFKAVFGGSASTLVQQLRPAVDGTVQKLETAVQQSKQTMRQLMKRCILAIAECRPEFAAAAVFRTICAQWDACETELEVKVDSHFRFGGNGGFQVATEVMSKVKDAFTSALREKMLEPFQGKTKAEAWEHIDKTYVVVLDYLPECAVNAVLYALDEQFHRLTSQLKEREMHARAAVAERKYFKRALPHLIVAKFWDDLVSIAAGWAAPVADQALQDLLDDFEGAKASLQLLLTRLDFEIASPDMRMHQSGANVAAALDRLLVFREVHSDIRRADGVPLALPPPTEACIVPATFLVPAAMGSIFRIFFLVRDGLPSLLDLQGAVAQEGEQPRAALEQLLVRHGLELRREAADEADVMSSLWLVLLATVFKLDPYVVPGREAVDDRDERERHVGAVARANAAANAAGGPAEGPAGLPSVQLLRRAVLKHLSTHMSKDMRCNVFDALVERRVSLADYTQQLLRGERSPGVLELNHACALWHINIVLWVQGRDMPFLIPGNNQFKKNNQEQPWQAYHIALVRSTTQPDAGVRHVFRGVQAHSGRARPGVRRTASFNEDMNQMQEIPAENRGGTGSAAAAIAKERAERAAARKRSPEGGQAGPSSSKR